MCKEPTGKTRQAVLDELDFHRDEFDENVEEVTELARDLFEADVSAVSLVGEDCQWFCATQGSENRVFPIEKSTCRFAIKQDGLFEISDLREDQRIPTPVVVDDRELRHYAGVPIELDGTPVGTLCVLSEDTGTLTQKQKDQFHILAELANRQIQLQQTKRRTEFLATHDPVTELPNRRSLLKNLEEKLQDPDIEQVTVGISRLYEFNRVEETLGYELGDRVLNEVSGKLREEFHPEIRLSVINRGTFAFFLPGKDKKDQLLKACRSLTDRLRQMVSQLAYQFTLRISTGIALAPEHAQEAEKLLGLARRAMTDAEESAGKDFQIFFPELAGVGDEALQLEKDFVDALQDGDLDLQYQPQIRLRNETVAGSEALIRWTHPDRGFVPPDQILELAEMTDREFELDCFVAREVLEQIEEWYQNESMKTLRASLNITYAPFLETNNFLSHLESTLKRLEVPPEKLELEVTEQKAMKNIEQTTDLLETIQERGIRVALDDFGTGYSSLNYLSELPIDVLKVDRSFVSGVYRQKKKQKVVQSILDMSNAMNLETVGEGPDQLEEVNMLRDHGCDYAQGYYYSKPVTPDQFESFVVNTST